MERQPVAYDYQLSETLSKLLKPGLLLASTKKDGKSNVMAIGWATVGIIWGKPIFQVLVRPSRYTYEFIENSMVFTVNVPTDAMRRWVGITGSVSGRNVDKFGQYNVVTSPALNVPTITINDCPMVYECRVVHFNDVLPPHLSDDIERGAYKGSDYHRIYFGQILGAYAAK
jgi:flavin reductase (DIM6/NTAB) family NADH-FMN oxidoreductase RutF